MNPKLVIFDADQTLVSSSTGKPPARLAEQTLLPQRLEICQKLREAGHILAVCSNQGGVAFGYSTREEAHERIRVLAEQIGAITYAVCVMHPRGRNPDMVADSPFRKPEAGMVNYLMHACGFQTEDVLFVGDSEDDMRAAANAMVEFEWTEYFFPGEDHPGMWQSLLQNAEAQP